MRRFIRALLRKRRMKKAAQERDQERYWKMKREEDEMVAALYSDAEFCTVESSLELAGMRKGLHPFQIDHLAKCLKANGWATTK